MSAPEVSVAMAVRNGAAFVSDAVASLRRQTLRDIEIIVVDDGSEDSTPSVLAQHAAEDSRVVVISAKPGGLARSLNMAIAAARGPWIARMDADDVAAMAFAGLARPPLLGLPGNLPSATGARGPRVLGAIYQA